MHAYTLERVTFERQGTRVLDIAALDFPANAVTALVGPNGAGKTTLLNLLAFLARPTQGTLRFMDREVYAPALAPARRRVGYLQQKPYLFNGSVRWNVEVPLRWRQYPAAERQRRVAAVMDRFGLEPLAARRAHELSGGEAQKVALARALAAEPEVLLMDEPFTFLDRRFSAELERWLRDPAGGRPPTVIFTTHDVALAERLGDGIRAMVGGRMAPFAPVNLFDGRISDGMFDTGRVRIHVAGGGPGVCRIAIDATQIVLSRERLDSSMRNALPGEVRALAEANGGLQVTVDAGETFTALVTRASWEDLGLKMGDRVWISFKSTAVHLLEETPAQP